MIQNLRSIESEDRFELHWGAVSQIESTVNRKPKLKFGAKKGALSWVGAMSGPLGDRLKISPKLLRCKMKILGWLGL